MNLWKLDESLQQMIDEATDRETGEINEEALFEIDALEFDREKKILALAGVIKGERCEGEAVRGQAHALSCRADGHMRRADSLEAYLLRHLHEGETMRDDRNWIKWRKSTAVIVDDISKLPSALVIQPDTPPPRADKAEIKRALKDGDVDGAHLELRTRVVIA